MDKFTYATLHRAADRLALEAARRLPAGLGEADCYLKTYCKVLDKLISEFEKNKVEP